MQYFNNLENNLSNEDNNNTLRLLKREDWKALDPKDELTDLIAPVDRVIIGHAATDECTTQVIYIFIFN